MSTSFPIIFISLFSALLRELPKLIFSKRTYLYEYVFFPSFFFFLFLYSALRRKFPQLIFSKMIYLSISFSHQLFFFSIFYITKYFTEVDIIFFPKYQKRYYSRHREFTISFSSGRLWWSRTRATRSTRWRSSFAPTRCSTRARFRRS